MKIYVYDKNTGILLGESNAQKNPKKNGAYLFPPNSTTIVPPTLTLNQVAIFNGTNWNVLKNYKGRLKINILTKEISEVTEFGELSEDYMLYEEYIKTDMYKEDLEKQKLELKKSEILNEMRIIDEKRIRAICEPSEKEDGITWLEYYNEKLYELRAKLSEVDNVY